MRKRKLLNIRNKITIEKSSVICIKLLKEFLQTDEIKKLGKNDNIFFKDYLSFIQQIHPKEFHKGSKQFKNEDVSLLCKLPP
jgi:hypothetical protein